MQSTTVFEAAMSSMLSSSRPVFNDDNYSLFFYLSMLNSVKWYKAVVELLVHHEEIIDGSDVNKAITSHQLGDLKST